MGKNIIGFDFGESRIKVVLYDGAKIKKAVAVDIPDNMMSEGTILSMDAMADFISETVKNNGIPKGNAAFILSSVGAYTKIISMPVMNHQQVLYNLPYEFADYLNEEKGSYYFDYTVLGTEKDESGKITEMRVFACAILKTVINDYRNMFKRAGYKLKIAVPTEYAYSRLLGQYIKSRNITGDDDYCIVDIGHTETRVFIYHGSEHVQRRNIEFGMKGITALISDNFAVDHHVAESYKRTDFNGVLESDYCKEYYENIAVEIMKTVNFFNYNNREAELKKIYLTGGGIAVKQISDKIIEMTGLEIGTVSEFFPEAGEIENKDLFAAAFGSVI